ncbi:gamma-glutamyltransferase [Parapedobacter lycopersici]|uniref:gamma-glutamyltransferase n=1 Tax=Parapedobacter lycopersici TaxID=1864939 RepID=UPI00214DE55C|nr:gamma-glutamyltransferase [Parapedobacter lycopersici]
MLTLLFLTWYTLPAGAQASKENLRPAALGKQGMVATANPLATLAGQKILVKGGNAIDAIVAAAATLNAVEPYMSGTGGVGYMLFYSAKENRVRSLIFGGWVPEHFDARAMAGDDKYADGAGHGGVMETVGPRTVAVPGNLAGWNRALEDYGTMSLAEVFESAIDYLETGIPITEMDQAMWAATVDRVINYPESAAIFLKNGKDPYVIGDVFTNKPLARTMRRIAEEGIDVFYRGDIARQIAAAFQRDGGFISEADLAAVPDRVNWVDPISIQYRDYTVYNNPPPGMGIQQLQVLKIMEGFDLKALGHNSVDYLAYLLEAIHLSRTDTDTYIGDPAFVPVPVDRLLSDDYIAQQRQKVIERVKQRKVKMQEAALSDVPFPIPMDDARNPRYTFATTSLSAVDQWGNAVVIIQTHGGGFGSGYVAGKTGLVFNSAMDWMTLEPGKANSVAPGKAVGWCIGGMMQFHRNGKPELIVGSPGSFGILQSVPQVAMNVVDFGMNIQDAISAARFRWKDELGSVPATELIMETRVPAEVRKTLQAMGYVLDTSLGDWTMTVGGVQGVAIDRSTGWLIGGADPRRNGYAMGW